MYLIHSILIDKSVPLQEAVSQAKEISKKKKIYMKEKTSKFHFRNIPKTKFEKKSFRSKKINPTRSEKYFPTIDDRNSIGFIAQEVEQLFSKRC